MPLGQTRPSQPNGQSRDNRGKLWENTKGTGPKSPAMTGVCTVDGRDYRVSAWNNDDGTVALAFKDKLEAQRQSTERSRDNYQRPIETRDDPRTHPQTNPLDDEIPY